ncbi:MAG: Lpg1974 family pore-forming outer membrane protein [Planctomycetota bacterium]|nr:Lpg1974 family pore-forming outer membrane protein [Planctomycetota bacterium]
MSACQQLTSRNQWVRLVAIGLAFWAFESNAADLDEATAPAPVVDKIDLLPPTHIAKPPSHIIPSVTLAAQPIEQSDSSRRLAFTPIGAEQEVLDAGRQLRDGNRQLLDAKREFIHSLPARNNETETDPALSNYYAPVTVNYYVSPEGQQLVRPATHTQDVDGYFEDQYDLAPYDGGGKKCHCSPCCRSLKTHCLGIFADALYLRPGNMDIVYTVEQRGTNPATATPTGPRGITAPDFEAGFRVGFSAPMSECASIIASYTWYQSDTNSAITAAPGTILGSRVTHPNVANTGNNANSASAKFDVDFQFVDLDYHRRLVGDCDWALNYTAGVRYGRLTQEFEAMQQTGVATGLATVTTDIDFDGVGIRVGLDGERQSNHTGLFIYGQGYANVLGGEYRAEYLQTNQLDPTANIGVNQDDYRVTTILQGELGIGWQSCSGRVRASIGYQGMGWHNALLTGAFIDNLGTTQLTQTNDNFLTFSGAVARFELRR